MAIEMGNPISSNWEMRQLREKAQKYETLFRRAYALSTRRGEGVNQALLFREKVAELLGVPFKAAKPNPASQDGELLSALQRLTEQARTHDLLERAADRENHPETSEEEAEKEASELRTALPQGFLLIRDSALVALQNRVNDLEKEVEELQSPKPSKWKFWIRSRNK